MASVEKGSSSMPAGFWLHTLLTVRHRRSPYSLLIDIMRLGGGLCVERCPFNAIEPAIFIRNPARRTAERPFDKNTGRNWGFDDSHASEQL
jgi:hypothetical protein